METKKDLNESETGLKPSKTTNKSERGLRRTTKFIFNQLIAHTHTFNVSEANNFDAEEQLAAVLLPDLFR